MRDSNELQKDSNQLRRLALICRAMGSISLGLGISTSTYLAGEIAHSGTFGHSSGGVIFDTFVLALGVFGVTEGTKMDHRANSIDQEINLIPHLNEDRNQEK